MAQRPFRTFRNKRRKSLYREEGEFGFIFNKVPRLAEGAPRSVPRGRRSGGGDGAVMATSLPGREEADTEEVEERGEEVEERGEEVEERGEEVEERGEEVEEGGEEEGEGDDFSMGSPTDDEKDIEIGCFIEQLKREFKGHEAAVDHQLDTALASVAAEMIKDQRYFRYLEEDEEEDASCHPLEEEVKEDIAALRKNIGMYERELREWDELEEELKANEAKLVKAVHMERSVNWSNLEPDTAGLLRTYLTPSQEGLLVGSWEGEGLAASLRPQLDAINAKIDEEMSRVREYCTSTSAQLHIERPDMSMVMETPITLLKALKQS